MITKFRIDEANASQEFGMACQRLVPWQEQQDEPPLGAMACLLPQGSSSEPDCHDQDEVMIILDGAGSIELDGETATFTAGDVMILPRNQEHVVHNRTSPRLTWVSLYWPLHEPKPEVTA